VVQEQKASIQVLILMIKIKMEVEVEAEEIVKVVALSKKQGIIDPIIIYISLTCTVRGATTVRISLALTTILFQKKSKFKSLIAIVMQVHKKCIVKRIDISNHILIRKNNKDSTKIILKMTRSWSMKMKCKTKCKVKKVKKDIHRRVQVGALNILCAKFLEKLKLILKTVEIKEI